MREQYERNIESKLNKIEHENSMLKHMFIESHNKNIMMQVWVYVCAFDCVYFYMGMVVY